MGYQDSERFGRERGYRGYRPDYGREDDRYRRRERSWRDDDRYGRDDHDERGFFERAGDEVRSWFGDEEAERRRREDERDYRREEGGRWAGAGRSERRDRDEDERWSGGGYVGGGYETGASRQRGFFSGDRAGDYGAGRGAGATGMWGLGAGYDREAWGYDPYRSWRERQMREFDRDYDEYRREHQSQFERDFGTWREGRLRQRQSLRRVMPHQEVVGSDGQHVGTVDKVRDDRIILTKSDPDAGGHHHSIPCAWIRDVGDRVEINMTADEAHTAWREEEDRSTFLGEEGRRRDEGPHILNRSFSGTY